MGAEIDAAVKHERMVRSRAVKAIRRSQGTVIFLLIVLAYTSWAFRMMWDRLTIAALAVNPDLY